MPFIGCVYVLSMIAIVQSQETSQNPLDIPMAITYLSYQQKQKYDLKMFNFASVHENNRSSFDGRVSDFEGSSTIRLPLFDPQTQNLQLKDKNDLYISNVEYVPSNILTKNRNSPDLTDFERFLITPYFRDHFSIFNPHTRDSQQTQLKWDLVEAGQMDKEKVQMDKATSQTTKNERQPRALQTCPDVPEPVSSVSCSNITRLICRSLIRARGYDMSGATTRVGQRPEGKQHKSREVVHTVKLHEKVEIDIIKVSDWREEGNAEIAPDPDEDNMVPEMVMASKIRGTNYTFPNGMPLDLLKRTIIITSTSYEEKELKQILEIDSKEDDGDSEALSVRAEVAEEISLRKGTEISSVDAIKINPMESRVSAGSEVDKKLDVTQPFQINNKQEYEMIPDPDDNIDDKEPTNHMVQRELQQFFLHSSSSIIRKPENQVFTQQS